MKYLYLNFDEYKIFAGEKYWIFFLFSIEMETGPNDNDPRRNLLGSKHFVTNLIQRICCGLCFDGSQIFSPTIILFTIVLAVSLKISTNL